MSIHASSPHFVSAVGLLFIYSKFLRSQFNVKSCNTFFQAYIVRVIAKDCQEHVESAFSYILFKKNKNKKHASTHFSLPYLLGLWSEKDIHHSQFV